MHLLFLTKRLKNKQEMQLRSDHSSLPLLPPSRLSQNTPHSKRAPIISLSIRANVFQHVTIKSEKQSSSKQLLAPIRQRSFFPLLRGLIVRNLDTQLLYLTNPSFSRRGRENGGFVAADSVAKELYSTKLRSPRDNGCPSARIHRRLTTLSNVSLLAKGFRLSILRGNNRSRTPERSHLLPADEFCLCLLLFRPDRVLRVLLKGMGSKSNPWVLLNQQFMLFINCFGMKNKQWN